MKDKNSYYYGYNIEDGYDSNKIKDLLIKDGIKTLTKKILVYIGYKCVFFFLRYFIINGDKYRYHQYKYNSVVGETAKYNTIIGERVIEIPFVTRYIKSCNGCKILEVGNVLSHFYQFEHDIIDKYEIGNSVKNIDIVDFDSNMKYDLIISISTLEHVGFDEPVLEPHKPAKALTKIIGLLSNGGMAIITVPLAYNPEIDDIIKNKKIAFSEAHFLKRVSYLNLWRETNLEDGLNCKYGSKYIFANSVAFLIYRK